MSISRLVSDLKDAGQDFEFYPTTAEIIGALVRDIAGYNDRRGDYSSRFSRTGCLASVLDVGAGNGKVLLALRDAAREACAHDAPEWSHPLRALETFYAIEKSPILCGQMDDAVFVIGTDFHEQSLISKTAAVTFCNPPYSEFEGWAVKIIRESASQLVYLVIPERWERSGPIAEALAFRGVLAHRVGAYDFEDSEDRTARAKVHLLRVDFTSRKESAFERAFQDEFADFIAGYETAREEEKAAPPLSRLDSIVHSASLPSALVNLYNGEMEQIRQNYRAASLLDPGLLKEFQIDPSKLMTCLRERLTGLRSVYWSELFSRMGPITSRLTGASRQKLLNTLNANRNVDFTVGNIHAVIVWALKNANRFIGSQLIDVYENMVDKANVKMYASNRRAFVDGWRHQREGEENSHYALEYRIVTHRVGGISHSYGDYKYRNKLSDRAGDFLGDLLTVAQTLGFVPCSGETIEESGQWVSGGSKEFGFTDWTTGKRAILFTVRAFGNGNLHLKFNSRFILALNVEHGRLKGWLKTPAEAAEELRETGAAMFFNATFQLPCARPENLLG